MKTERKKTLLFSVVTLVLFSIPALVLAEWGARVRYHRSIEKESSGFPLDSIFRRSEDAELVYELKPNAELPGIEEPVRINSDGFRDDPFVSSATGDSYRIVLLGDSVAWGHGVDTHDAFPQLLETLLNERIPEASPPIEIYNLAITGYSTSQEARLLELRGLAYRPDLVIVAYVLNDPDEVDGGLKRYFAPPRIYLLDSLVRLRRWWAAERIGRTQGGGYPEVIHTLYWDDVMKNLDRFQNISEKYGVPLLFIQIPALTWKGENYPEWNLEKRLAREFRKRGFLVHPLWPAFRGTDAESLRYDYWHPTEEGHRIIAEDLSKALPGLLKEISDKRKSSRSPFPGKSRENEE